MGVKIFNVGINSIRFGEVQGGLKQISFDASRIQSLNSPEDYIRGVDAAFKEVYSIFFSIYENKLSDIDDMDFHDTFNALIYEFTIKLCNFIIDQVRT